VPNLRSPAQPDRRRFLTPEQERQARELWAAGGSRDEIARAIGATVDVVRARLLDQLADLPRRGRGGNRRPPSPDPSLEEIAAAKAELRRRWMADRWFSPPREHESPAAAW
jgi:hypothetical protein